MSSRAFRRRPRGIGSIKSIEFFQGTGLPIPGSKILVPPYEFEWAPSAGSYAVFARATNDADLVADSSPVTLLVNAPIVALDGVQDGQTLYEGTGVELIASGQDAHSTIAMLDISINGLSVSNAAGQGPLRHGWTPLPLGTHWVRATAWNAAGSTSSISKSVNVTVDPQDVPFRNQLQGFKTALAAGNKQAAMAFLSPTAQQAYGPVIDALMPHLAGIVASWSAPTRIHVSVEDAEYAVTRVHEGIVKVYILGFVLTDSGAWVIDSM